MSAIGIGAQYFNSVRPPIGRSERSGSGDLSLLGANIVEMFAILRVKRRGTANRTAGPAEAGHYVYERKRVLRVSIGPCGSVRALTRAVDGSMIATAHYIPRFHWVPPTEGARL